MSPFCELKRSLATCFFYISSFVGILFPEATVNSWLNYCNNSLFIGLLAYNFSTLLSIEKYCNICITSLSIQFLPPTRDSRFSNLFLLLCWQNLFFKRNVRKQSNKRTTSLAEAGVAGYSPGVSGATLWGHFASMKHGERLPLPVFAASFHVRPPGSRQPLSSPLYLTQSQMSTFQTHLQGLFQVLSPPQKAFLPSRYSSPLMSRVSELSILIFHTLKPSTEVKALTCQLQLPCNCFMYASLISPT